MALITEDGTGLPDAESYCSVADADKYFADRQVADWTAMSVADKESALRKATDYIELRYGSRFRGVQFSTTQALSFPRDVRENTYDPALSGGVPRGLLRACAEYALRAKTAPLVADPVVDASGLAVKATRKKMGPMEKQTEYATTVADLFKPYPAADMLLKSLLRPGQLIR